MRCPHVPSAARPCKGANESSFDGEERAPGAERALFWRGVCSAGRSFSSGFCQGTWHRCCSWARGCGQTSLAWYDRASPAQRFPCALLIISRSPRRVFDPSSSVLSLCVRGDFWGGRKIKTSVTNRLQKVPTADADEGGHRQAPKSQCPKVPSSTPSFASILQWPRPRALVLHSRMRATRSSR